MILTHLSHLKDKKGSSCWGSRRICEKDFLGDQSVKGTRFIRVCEGTSLAESGEIPGGLVVRILGFHCHGPGSISGRGTEIPQAVWHSQHKQTNKEKGASGLPRDHVENLICDTVRPLPRKCSGWEMGWLLAVVWLSLWGGIKALVRMGGNKDGLEAGLPLG